MMNLFYALLLSTLNFFIIHFIVFYYITITYSVKHINDMKKDEISDILNQHTDEINRMVFRIGTVQLVILNFILIAQL